MSCVQLHIELMVIGNVDCCGWYLSDKNHSFKSYMIIGNTYNQTPKYHYKILGTFFRSRALLKPKTVHICYLLSVNIKISKLVIYNLYLNWLIIKVSQIWYYSLTISSFDLWGQLSFMIFDLYVISIPNYLRF